MHIHSEIYVKHTCSTYIGYIVAAVLLFGAAAAVLLALLVLEGSVILSELFAVLEHKAERTLLMHERCSSQDAREGQTRCASNRFYAPGASEADKVNGCKKSCTYDLHNFTRVTLSHSTGRPAGRLTRVAQLCEALRRSIPLVRQGIALA